MSLRSAVVTGANRGIGLELCKQLSKSESYQTVYALCRKTSEGLQKLASASKKVQVLDGIDVTNDESVKKLQSLLKTNEAEPVEIDLLVHNAGAYGPWRDWKTPMEVYSSQTLDKIDAETMMFDFQLNAMAPLFVTKALLPNLKFRTKDEKDDVRKVVIITSLMGSIEDNGSGGHYGYRTAKAAVNMIGKSLSVDLKSDNVAVSLVHPGMVYTGFGGSGDEGTAMERRPGQRDVDESTRGVIEAIDATDLDSTGSFFHGNYGEGIKPLKW